MNPFELTHFYFEYTNEGLCANDFDNISKDVIINLNHIVSISDVKKFHSPFSNKFIGKYAIVTMINGEKYYIAPDTRYSLIARIC